MPEANHGIALSSSFKIDLACATTTWRVRPPGAMSIGCCLLLQDVDSLKFQGFADVYDSPEDGAVAVCLVGG